MATGSPNTQTMHLQLDGGVDQRQHPRQLTGPSVIAATNVRFPRIGAVDKRPGTDELATTFFNGGASSPMTPGQGRVIAFRDELLVTDAFKIASLSNVGGVPKLIEKGKVPEATSKSRAVGTTQYYVSQPDVAYTSTGLVMHVWAANDRFA